MNWGYRIALLYTFFALFMFTMVFSTFRYDVNLVAKDYYKQEIAYGDEMNKIRNMQGLKNNFHLKYNANNKVLDLQMPLKAEGEIHLFRPADSNLDLKFPLSLDENSQQAIPIDKLNAGLWRVKINWNKNDKKYYIEEKFFIEANGNVKIGKEIKLKSVKF